MRLGRVRTGRGCPGSAARSVWQAALRCNRVLQFSRMNETSAIPTDRRWHTGFGAASDPTSPTCPTSPAAPSSEHTGGCAHELVRVVALIEAELCSTGRGVACAVGHLARYRGKMLRPTLALTTAKLVDVHAPLTDDAIALAAVCEMVHLATLVHDDVLDAADTRRGGPSINASLGNETAVLLGDLLFSRAYALCAGVRTSSGQTTYAQRMGVVAAQMCEGELLQLHHRNDERVSSETYFAIIDAKTAGLIGLSCRFGAMVAGHNDAACERAERIGRLLGAAFQIQDDILDLTSTAGVLGKPTGSDIGCGTFTLPLILHLHEASEIDRGACRSLLDRMTDAPPIARAARTHLVSLLESSGALSRARAEAQRLVTEAASLVGAFPPSPARSSLLSMAQHVLDRSR